MINRREFLAGGLAVPAMLLPQALAGAAAPRVLARGGDGENPGQPDAFEEVARLITAKMAEHRIPGVAFGVLRAGTVTTRGFGVTNLDDPHPVTADTVFPIASISKTVCATAIMRLVEQGRLELRVPVRRYLPDFRVQDDATAGTVSIWHLLTHTPGWEGQLAAPDRGSETLAQFTDSLRDVPQLAPAGAVWSYNNAGFGVAGRVIEVVTERSIHDALRELVFAPLELRHAMSRAGDVLTHRVAVPHRDRGGAAEVIRPFNLSTNITAGGVIMSVASLLDYAAFHLGERGGEPLLSRTSIEAMRTAQHPKNPTDDEIGLAWQLRRLGGVLTAAHGGTLAGHCLHFQIVPERRLAFAILTNHSSGWRLIQEVERSTLRLYEGLSLAPGQLICHRGVNEAMSDHATPLATQPDPREYVGSYRRPPLGTVEVREREGTLTAGNASLVFHGRDAAYATSGAYVGQPYEFVRRPDGTVGWIRVNGRIARKDPA